MSQSPPLEATGEHQALGATSVNQQGIKGSMGLDSEQRKAYFGGGEQLTSQQPSAGAGVEKAATDAEQAAKYAADKYKEDKERRF